jgi:hypothetical protein
VINKTIRHPQITLLKAQIRKLQREKAQLRAFLHEMVEAHYRVINQALEEEENDHE